MPEAGLTILFGSQSGNAEFLAHEISAAATQAGIEVEISALDDALREGNLAWQRLLIVTSTHDDGNMPENAEGFWVWLQTCPPDRFKGLPYAVLALGDSMYEEFCQAGRDFDETFAQLGAHQILERIDCDVDYDMTAAPWIKKFLNALPDTTAWSPREPIEVDLESTPQLSSEPEQWQLGEVTAARLLSRTGSNKRVWHYEIKHDENFAYLPGDSVEIQPTNSDQLVNDWIATFPTVKNVILDGNSMPFADALKHHLELRLPHIGLINTLVNRIPSSEAADRIRNLLESGDREKIDNWLDGRDVLQIITELGFHKREIDEIITLLRPLQSRSFSIASSPSATPLQFSLTVASVQYSAEDRKQYGCATSFLENSLRNSIPIRRVVTNSFRLPEDAAPVIMIGPGVGVAPFIGFLHEIESTGRMNDTWLFFGDQHRETDWFFHDEMQQWLSNGVLKRLNLAFSRDQEEKHYVQHELLTQAADIRDWVRRGAHIYICGEKSPMARQVEETLEKILEGNNSNEVDGAHTLEQLRAEGRYLKDVY